MKMQDNIFADMKVSYKEVYKRASRRVEKRRFKKYRFYKRISGPVTILAILALLDEHVTSHYEGQFKPPLKVVVVTRKLKM